MTNISSMLLNLVFANNTFFSYFFFFFLIIDLYSLISAVIEQIVNPFIKLVIRIGIPSKEAKVEIEIHPVTTEARMRKCSV